ncbi:MAG: glycosyltransferase family 4 protein [Phycisphaerales bacterium]|nr:glycosyltransferase family 4 protein [Phycisphaerae bacterium]NNF44370.1 glycosyltransferase family 4 protein [Phycisphaerales bacterium]NNM25493.1 glycosyltransferase family 4 protein [Phycisphaerales bacterium]
MNATNDAATDRLRVVILNQYYVPDVASTGHLLHELAEDLAAQGVEVSVITSRPSYGPPETWQPCPRREFTNGVNVNRMITTRLSKDHLFGRVLNSLTFLSPLMFRMLFRRGPGEVFLYTTNPPYLGVIGAVVSVLRRHRYVVLLHDSYPQLATWVGKIRPGGLIERIWHRMNRTIYGRAEQTIVLCRAARTLVCEKYNVDPERVHIIHNWADGEKLHPIPKAESDFAKEHDLVEPFTVLYSGNLGLYYEFDTILRAAELLKDENFRLVLIGAGGKRSWIEKQIADRGLRHTELLPYQPFERLNDSLNACDVSLVTIAEGIEGISYPSKLYSSLAIGKPILALSEHDSELRQVLTEHGVGRWHALGDADGVAESIRGMMADPGGTARMGANARTLFEKQFTLQASSRHYAEVLRLAAGLPAGDA